MNCSRLGLILFAIIGFSAHGASLKTLDPVGAHYPILTFEKNENPQNIMIIYTKLNEHCQFVSDDESHGKPTFSFYWLMDRKDYKRVHPMIRSGIRKRLQVETEAGHNDRFEVALNDLKDLKTDLKNPHMEIEATSDQKDPTHCQVKALMKLGPSDGEKTILLNTIYSESRKSWLPPFRKVKAITLKGVDVKSGQPIERRFTSRSDDD